MTSILRFALATILAVICLSASAQVTPPNGVEATSTPLAAPAGLVYDAAGNLYIASLNQNVIRKVDLKGIITTVAGTGEQGFFGDGAAATSAVLDSPAGIAIDAAGNLYIADTHNNRIREVNASTGIITTIAGTGVAGFSGDGAAATAATLNLPTALALDSAGNLYIADTNNNRIRKITGTTITTVAGDGEQVFAGDGGLATAAGLDSPGGIALDASNNIYIADTHDQRIRLVTIATGIITTYAGTGTKAFGGDAGAATAASLARPRGLSIDSAGKLYIADSDNNRIRAISGTTISTIAGAGDESFTGDTGPATTATLDTPRATAAVGSGTTESIAFSDTNNQRARAISSNGVIETVAGLGAAGAPALNLTGSTTAAYGATATLTATYVNQSSIGTGTVTLLEGTTTRGTGTLSGNSVTFALSALSIGTHYLAASYTGDATNPAEASGIFALVISPVPITVAANPISVAYGLPIPALSGVLTGVLPADAANVTAVYSTTATQGSDVGAYPISTTLTGSAASNYTVSFTTGSVTITVASTTTTLKVDANPALLGVPIHLTATVAAATAGTVGTPTGSVNFFLNGVLAGNSPLTAGVATLTASPVLGTLPMYAVYVPSTTPVQDWTASFSSTISESITADPDFTLTSSGISQTVVPGSSASYAISVLPNPAPFTGAVTFSVSGLPTGATATFSPTSVTPGSNTAGTTMTVTVPAVHAMLHKATDISATVAFALFLLPLVSRKRRRKFSRLTAALLLCFGSAVAMTALSGCGTSTGFFGQGAKTYTLTITGTSNNIVNAPLVHTTTVTLIVE